MKAVISVTQVVWVMHWLVASMLFEGLSLSWIRGGSIELGMASCSVGASLLCAPSQSSVHPSQADSVCLEVVSSPTGQELSPQPFLTRHSTDMPAWCFVLDFDPLVINQDSICWSGIQNWGKHIYPLRVCHRVPKKNYKGQGGRKGHRAFVPSLSVHPAGIVYVQLYCISLNPIPVCKEAFFCRYG